MLSKRRSSTAGDTVIKQGCLIKSPPTGVLFTSRGSWKERVVKICRAPLGAHHIRYYSYSGEREDLKGEIAISDIQSIELGTNLRERMQTIIKLFNNSPENVLCIKTNKRDYYLVDDDKNNILDWKTCLTDIWVQSNSTSNVEGAQIGHLPGLPATLSQTPPLARPLKRGMGVYRKPPLLSSAEEATAQHDNLPGQSLTAEAARPNSYPQNHTRTDPALVETQDRQRSLTDPDSRRPRLQFSFERTEEIVRKAERRRSSEDSTEVNAAYTSDSEEEHIYDIPRLFSVVGCEKKEKMQSMFRSLRDSLPSLDNNEDALSSGFDSPDDDGYEPMQPLPPNFFDSETNSSASAATEQSAPHLPEVAGCSRVPEQTGRSPQNPKKNTNLWAEPIRYPKTQGSQLKKAYMLKLMFEERDDSDLVKMDITVPTAHLKTYLGVQEVGERLCIRKWKGPSEIGCLFHHGDHIEAVNGVRPGTEDFFLQMLNKSVTDKVNLVVIRNKNAGVFHVEGCRCGES